ncbi:N-acetylmuramoyl-L-alanine amidase [Rhodoligotrophos defluvii]|uniref:N-acetylmuramoyl-L-alanine amidase n=1 Tax=Rhodoligotrophos defluvii TaxID=2561934 RepID=UPI0010C9502D|nr:N-acetylmuramoyl-L-alanine amidase [Rhodoligotrophos defluvii]
MQHCPSPNFGERAPGTSIDILLLHYTGMQSADAARRWLCDPRSQVSCHYLIDEAGLITRMVPEEKRAWHAGVSSWQGKEDINSRSVGIEIHNPGHDGGYPPFPAVQMAAVTELCSDILARHRIAPARVLAHSDVAPGRKIDPGEKFDWGQLHAAGIGHWVEPEPIVPGQELRFGDRGESVRDLQRKLAAYGYGIEPTGEYDQRTMDVVAAFQRHFRQARVDGIADLSTIGTLERLTEAIGPADV